MRRAVALRCRYGGRRLPARRCAGRQHQAVLGRGRRGLGPRARHHWRQGSARSAPPRHHTRHELACAHCPLRDSHGQCCATAPSTAALSLHPSGPGSQLVPCYRAACGVCRQRHSCAAPCGRRGVPNWHAGRCFSPAHTIKQRGASGQQLGAVSDCTTLAAATRRPHGCALRPTPRHRRVGAAAVPRPPSC